VRLDDFDSNIVQSIRFHRRGRFAGSNAIPVALQRRRVSLRLDKNFKLQRRRVLLQTSQILNLDEAVSLETTQILNCT